MQTSRRSRFFRFLALLFIFLGILGLFLLSLEDPARRQVIVYTALDEVFSQPVFDEFTRQTGIEVLAKFDTESTKTVGLTQAIFAERDRPRCDVFWNNEIVNTLRLDQAELLGRYETLSAVSFPAQYRSAQGVWHGFAARARVLVVNTDLVDIEAYPRSIMDLIDPEWQGKVGFAKPLAGTTASHAACLFTKWGDEKAKIFFRELKKNARVMAGNKQVALAVGTGELAFGLTDTDDAIIEQEQGRPVTIVYPDQGEGELGTLFIPNTVAIIQGAPHREAAERLVDYLLSPEVEAMLAVGPSAQIPLNPAVEKQPRVETPRSVSAMEIDFEEAAANWQQAAAFLRDEFARAD